MFKTESLRIIAPLALVASLGLSACSNTTPNAKPAATIPAEADCSSFTDIHLIGAAKNGGYNADNAGNCATAYDRQNIAHTVGRIAHDEAFVIDCNGGPKPASFDVRFTDADTRRAVEGTVNLDYPMINRLQNGDFAEIPNCQ